MPLPFLVLALATSLGVALDSTKIPVPHPLAPLTGAEMLLVREILISEGKLTPHLRFGVLALREPPKEAVRQQEASGVPRRSAEAVLYDWGSSTPILAHIDLGRRRVIRWDSLASREPPSRNMIRRRLEEIVRPDPRWAAALKRHGITDPDRISVLPALGESQSIPWRGQDRVINAVTYTQEAIGSDRRLRGVRMEVNLSRASILSFSDTAAVPTPPPPGPAAKSSHVTAPPSGPAGLTIQGTLVQWREWRLHFGVHPRRGLELWKVRWVENGGERSILYRASVSEAISIYGDAGFVRWYPRDAGDEGLGGTQRNSAVELGDAPSGAVFADAVMPDHFGRPVTVPRAVAIYERDGGVLWRHAGRARRARQLVLTSHATIDNYDFVFNWILAEDGAIQIEVGMTGLVLQRRLTDEERADSGHTARHLVAPRTVAPHHQHFFSYRLDFDVDGSSPNRVLEIETEAMARNRGNRDGLWFGVREQPLRSERQAVRTVNAATSRRWRIANSAKRNGLGGDVGYVLDPGQIAFPAPGPGSPARRHAGFVNAQLFVTPFRRDEMHAAGDFQNFAMDGQGLPVWIAGDRALLDTDIVVWHTVGMTHLPRPEEFPVMPVQWAGFRLIPSGFFSKNPVLEDLKP